MSNCKAGHDKNFLFAIIPNFKIPRHSQRVR